MNRSYRSLWNDSTGTFVAVSENASSAGKRTSSGVNAVGIDIGTGFALQALAVSVMLTFGANALAQPTGGVVAAGAATISTGATSTTINQSTQNAIINWQSFNIAAGQSVQFVQPGSSSVALNRVLGADPSSILGSLTANGQVFLVNPNGILFGKGAQVNVGGLVASSLAIADGDFMAGNYKFGGPGDGAVLNQGTINADGGYVALLGANVGNDGVIAAQLGTVALAGGNAITLDVAGDGLLNVSVNQGAVNALVQNGGLIQADGGRVLLTAQSASSLLQSAVNNTGVVRAQTLVTGENGSIMLMGDMQSGTVNVGGTLDASAPNGGNGGFVETSAAHVKIASDANITTVAPAGLTGTWLIDPIDFNIEAIGGDITGPALTALLVNNNVTISTVATGTNTETTFFAAPGQGDINVNDAIGTGTSWTAAGNATTLTLMAAGDVNINKPITATNGNLVACCGQDVNVRAAITTTNGSVLLSAGRDVNLFAGSAMTTTNGNIELCAGRDVIVNSKITLTDSGSIPSQSLDLPLGLTLISGANGSGPGAASGSVYLPGAADPLRPTVTKAGAPATDVRIYYNPTSYTTPTDYSTSFILTGATLTQYMLVYPGVVDKTFNGDTTATLSGFQSTALSGFVPGSVTLVSGPLATANFDTAAVGVGKTVTYSGFSLTQDSIATGGTATNFALPVACCTPVARKTTGNVIAAIVVSPPVEPPVVVVPPVEPPVVVVSPGQPPVVVVPPVEPPVVVVPPVEPPVVVIPPEVVTPPDAIAPPELPYRGPVVPPRFNLPTWVPVVVPPVLPPQLVSLVPPVPPVVPPVVRVPVPEVVTPVPVVVQPPVAPPPVYVAPVRPRKQDRN